MLPTFTNQIGLISEWLPYFETKLHGPQVDQIRPGNFRSNQVGHHAIELRELVIWLYGYMAMDQYLLIPFLGG